MKPVYWLFLSSIFFAAGEIYSKKFAVRPAISYSYVFVILVSYLICSVLWLPAIRETKTLSTTGAAWSVLGLILTVLIGTIVFGEKLELVHWIGLVCGAVAVYTLSL